jgi:hypothetical protein
MFKRVNKLINRLCWVPLVLGFVGYCFLDGGDGTEKLGAFQSLYASVALYFVNPVADNYNALILISELLAVVVTTNAILSAVSILFSSLNHWFSRRFKDSTAVYTDNFWGEQLAGTLKHGYIAKEANGKIENTKDYILMYDDDLENLKFIEENKEKLKSRRVFAALNHVDSSLLRSSSDHNIHFFNVYELVARCYWKEYNLYEELKKAEDTYKIAIIGFGSVGKAIFKYGYLNNIYSLSQNIEYHIWGADELDKKFLSKLEMANGDIVTTHNGNYEHDIEEICGMNRVIVTDGDVLSIVQQLILEKTTLQVHCYNIDGTDVKQIFNCDTLHTFGDTSNILTEENVKTEKLYRMAKLLNYDYCLRSKNADKNAKLTDEDNAELEREWAGLDGFTKGSNIARADFYWIECKCKDEGATDKYVLEMEHIRWCRYHYYNHWTYKEGKKDKINRTHGDLIPFEKLSEDEKSKDGFYSKAVQEEVERLM